MWNVDGPILEANDAFLHMVEYRRDDLASGRVRWRKLTPGSSSHLVSFLASGDRHGWLLWCGLFFHPAISALRAVEHGGGLISFDYAFLLYKPTMMALRTFKCLHAETEGKSHALGHYACPKAPKIAGGCPRSSD